MKAEFLLQCLWAFFGSLGFGVVFHIRKKNLFFAALGGSVGWLVYLLFTGVFPSDLMQYFLGAFAISLYAELMAVFRKAPVTVFLVASMIPMVPGGMIYYTMEALILRDTVRFIESGVYTFEIAGAIALGILLGSFLVRAVRRARTQFRQKQQGHTA